MNRHVMHNLIHSDYGAESSRCPVCNGTVTKDADMLSMVEAILAKKQANYGPYGFSSKSSGIKTASLKALEDVSLRPLYQFGEKTADGALPKEIMLVPLGKWNTVKYGEVEITKEDIEQMADNFNNKVRKGVMIDVDHGASSHGDAAAGWIKKVEARDDGLWSVETSWTPLGDKLVSGEEYKYLSPEFDIVYIDPQDANKILENVLIATSLVNRPLLREIPELSSSYAFSEKNLTNNKNNVMLFIDQLKPDQKQGPTMITKESVLAKLTANETLSAEEVTFITTNKAQFSEDELKKAGVEVTAPAPTNTPADAGISAKEGDKTSVSISASELADLRAKAEKGEASFKAMERESLKKEFHAFTFNEKGGKYSPATADKLVTFAEKLTPAQRVEFSEIISGLPEKQIFGEKGTDQDVTASQNTDALRAEIAQYSKDNGVSFGEATKALIKSQPAKFAEYNNGIRGEK